MIDLDPKTTALINIDLQGFILGLGLQPHPTPTVLAHTVQLANRVRALGGLVISVQVIVTPGLPEMVKTPVDTPATLPEGGLPEAAMAFHPDIAALNAEVVIVKRSWSAFYGTELDLQLRRRGIDTVIITGVATNFGVESTARDAWHHNYAVVIAEDACASRDEAMHRFAIDAILPRISRVRSTDEILAGLAE